MSAAPAGLHLTPQEAIARDVIMERVARRHRVRRPVHPNRAALLLRSLADRLDHGQQDLVDSGDRGDHRVAGRPLLG